jgi:hypothetical protein
MSRPPIDHRLMDAISRAIVRSKRSGQMLNVCVRSSDDEELMTLRLGSYKEVQELALELRELGYGLTIMHPVHKHCDFLLEPAAQP